MADFVQLSDLQGQVQQRADIAGSLQAFPLTYLTEQINKGWRWVYGILCETGEDYYTTTFLFSSVAAQNQYYTTAASGVPAGCNVLPLDMYKVRGVDGACAGPGQYEPLERSEFESRCDVSASSAWAWPVTRPRYQYIGSGNSASLLFTGGALQIMQLRLWYFPVPPLLVNAADTIDAANGWDVGLVDWAARRCAEKDENYDLCSRLDLSLSEFEARLKKEAANRNSGQASKIRRVRGRCSRGWGSGGYGGGYGGY